MCLGCVAHGDGDLDPAQDERGGDAGDVEEHLRDGGSELVELSVAPVQCGGVHVAEAFHGLVSDAPVIVLDRCFVRQSSYDVDVLEDVARGLRVGLMERGSAGDVGDGLAGQAWGVVTGSVEMPVGDAFAVHPSDHHFHLAPAAGCVFGLVGVVGTVPDLEVGSFPEKRRLGDPLDAEPLERGKIENEPPMGVLRPEVSASSTLPIPSIVSSNANFDLHERGEPAARLNRGALGHVQLLEGCIERVLVFNGNDQPVVGPVENVHGLDVDLLIG